MAELGAVERGVGLFPENPANFPNGNEVTVAAETAELTNSRREISGRSEEHTSELQSHHDLVCRLLLEKKKMQFSLMNFADQSFHCHPYIVYNRLVDRVLYDRIFHITEQQITFSRSDAWHGHEGLYHQI